MRECLPYVSVREARSDARPYRVQEAQIEQNMEMGQDVIEVAPISWSFTKPGQLRIQDRGRTATPSAMRSLGCRITRSSSASPFNTSASVSLR